MPTITELGTERPKTDGEMTCLKKKNIDESIHQNLRKKDVYESDMHKIYNLIVGKTNEQHRVHELRVHELRVHELRVHELPVD